MKILLTHDGSVMADVAVPAVQALVDFLGAEAEIVALCITPARAKEGSAEMVAAEESLDRISRVLAPHPIERIIRGGSAGPLVVQTAEELGCDLIAMSTAGVSGEKSFLGSVADHVARGSHRIPVMLCRPMRAGTKHFGKILMPLDGSAMNDGALSWTEQLASITGADVVLVRSVDTAEGLRSIRTPAGYELSTEIVNDETIEQVLATELQIANRELAVEADRLRALGSHDIVAKVIHGTPGETIVHAAGTEKCDVIVMSPGGRGRGIGVRILGSVADHVLQHVGEAAVIVVPPSEDAT